MATMSFTCSSVPSGIRTGMGVQHPSAPCVPSRNLTISCLSLICIMTLSYSTISKLVNTSSDLGGYGTATVLTIFDIVAIVVSVATLHG